MAFGTQPGIGYGGGQIKLDPAVANTIGPRPQAPAPMPPVRAAISALDDAASCLHAAVSRLEAQLSPVLAQQPAETGVNKLASDTHPNVAIALADLAQRVMGATQRLNEIGHRLEI